MVSNSENKREFIELCSGIHRDGIDDLMKWLESSDFYSAPASSRFHGAYAGGLLEHSLNVYHELKRLLSVYPEINVDEESVVISSLFHDLCKVNFYKPEEKYKKDDLGKWVRYDGFSFDEKLKYGGHGSKSVFLVQQFIKLKPIEAVAINCHMSCWDGNKDVGDAYEACPFAWLVHVADESATYVVETNGERN